MKHSIRGNLRAVTESDRAAVVADINKYSLWGLKVDTTVPEIMSFEAWVPSLEAADALWADMRERADALGGSVDRHLCTHDEPQHQPCTITEIYTAGG